ncbi:unnamed protein product, partial [Rotaria magnacalcarata]
TLNDLWLHENKIGNVGAHYLADALRKNRGLTDLNLCSNQINDDGTQYLADALRENKVVSSTQIYIKHAFASFLHWSGPLYGSIYSYEPKTSAMKFFANYSYKIDDNDTELYYFEPGPIAIVKNTSMVYSAVECGTAFQRLLLFSFDMKTKVFKQSRWILHDGEFAYIFHDPIRQRLFGLRDVFTFTLIIEEYNMTTLGIIRKYTQQDGEKYAFPYGGCAVFDYEENWIVEVRTRLEDVGINAYFVKMDLNLVGQKEDIVADFHLMRNVHNLCSMKYDIKTKKILDTWQKGSIDLDLRMLYMDSYTGKFTNEKLLLMTPK